MFFYKRLGNRKIMTIIVSLPDSKHRSSEFKSSLESNFWIHSCVWNKQRGVSFPSRLILEIESRYSESRRHTFELLPTAFGRYFLPISISLSLTKRRPLIE